MSEVIITLHSAKHCVLDEAVNYHVSVKEIEQRVLRVQTVINCFILIAFFCIQTSIFFFLVISSLLKREILMLAIGNNLLGNSNLF